MFVDFVMGVITLLSLFEHTSPRTGSALFAERCCLRALAYTSLHLQMYALASSIKQDILSDHVRSSFQSRSGFCKDVPYLNGTFSFSILTAVGPHCGPLRPHT